MPRRLMAVARRVAILSSMSGEVARQAVNAVLAPPQAERFAGVADVDLGRLVLNVTGRNKRRYWSTATFTKTSCWPTAVG
jgi:hypothetical protein